MEPHHVIKKPILSEKITHQTEDANQYAFEVALTARKGEIKSAIEELYGVKVLKVNTIRTRSRNRRMRYGLVKGKEQKKAIVRIHPDQVIELI